MKNVIIVTWTGVHNYGTALQSFALQFAIERMGYRVNIMDKILYGNSLKITYRKARAFLKNRLREKNSKAFKMERFHRKVQHIIRPVNKRGIENVVRQTDIFISGSDQIWNTAHHYSPMMFLDFAKSKKRISYATSIGTETIPEKYKETIKQHLLKYDHISVREESAQKVLSELTKRTDITTVLDPTFLLSEKDWLQFASFSKIGRELPKEYLFCYFVGNNNYYNAQVEDIIKKSRIKDVIIATLKNTTSLSINGAIIFNNADPHDFVHLIKNATLVCTDSFHATAISINLSKQFVALLRFQDKEQTSQNSRIYNLLNHYGLFQYLYTEKSDDWNNIIDYGYVHRILEKDRNSSLKYLEEAITQ